jgi:iron complex transport system permease protein
MKRRFAILVMILLATVAVALFLGPTKATEGVLLQLRLPRVLLGSLVGVALAVAGAIFQGLLRNPLADPYILGTSSGASLGVFLAGFLHLRSPLALYGMAWALALASIAAVYRIALTQGQAPVQTLVLAGVIVATFLNALVFLGISLFYKEAFSTLFFLLGTLTEYDPRLLTVSAVLIVTASAAACFLAADLNVLSQGEDTAFHLGIDPERIKRWLFLIASVLVSAAVAASGMIGFVGLMVPHVMRLILGPDHRWLLPGSALGGAVLLVSMDALARTVAQPVEIPVGVLTALGGTPFFIYLLKTKKAEIF